MVSGPKGDPNVPNYAVVVGFAEPLLDTAPIQAEAELANIYIEFLPIGG
jgi:hypothetical protein